MSCDAERASYFAAAAFNHFWMDAASMSDAVRTLSIRWVAPALHPSALGLAKKLIATSSLNDASAQTFFPPTW